MKCPKCQTENLADASFCEECSAPLEAACPACGTGNRPSAKFCRKCRASLNDSPQSRVESPLRSSIPEPRSYTPKHLADKILQSRSALEGERKQVTVLFADLKGSMELAEQLDPEEWSAIMQRFFRILSDGVERFEGFVDKFTGDGIMALFGAPIAHEDHAQRACYAALHLRDTLKTYADALILTTKADRDEVGGIGRLTFDLADVDSLATAVQVRRAAADVSDDVNGELTNPDFTTTSVAAENAYLFSERISLVSGVSFDLQSGGASKQWELNPQGGIVVDFGRYGTSRAAISRKMRFPTLRELFDPLRGNPDLKPEKALVYEIGHRVQIAQAYADLNLFRSDVSDLIENEGGDLGQAVNLQDATLPGVEVAVGGTPADWVRLDVNYTYLNAQASNPSRSGISESDVQHRPPHRFNGVLASSCRSSSWCGSRDCTHQISSTASAAT